MVTDHLGAPLPGATVSIKGNETQVLKLILTEITLLESLVQIQYLYLGTLGLQPKKSLWAPIQPSM